MTLLTDAKVLRMAADSPDPKVRAAAMRWRARRVRHAWVALASGFLMNCASSSTA